MMRKFLNDICYNRKTLSYIIGFLMCFIFLSIFWTDSIYGDASGYSTMAEKFIESGLGNFRLQLEEGSSEAYQFSVRGYAWPWIIAFFKEISFQTKIGWWVVYSLFISFGFTFLLPEIFELLFNKRIKCFARIVPLALTLFIWPGLVIYTLSDIPSIIFMALGLYVVLLICKRELHIYIRLILGILAGFWLGFSYYIRSGNIVSVILALLILCIYSCRKCFSKKLIVVIAFCLGVGISTLPQIAINVNCNHKFSYQVPVFFTSGIGAREYFYGVSLLRYETVISEAYPEIAARSWDGFAGTLLNSDNIPENQVDGRSLLNNILKYPVEYLGIFSAKFANFAESRFGELYIQNFKYRSNGKVVFNFFLYFMSFFGIFYLLSNKKNNEGKLIGNSIELTNVIDFLKKDFLYILAFLAPSLMHIMGTHVESRYVFGMQWFLWQLLAGIIPWKELAIKIWNHILSYMILFIVLLGCCSAIWNFTLEQIPFYGYCLQKEPEKTFLSQEEFEKEYTERTEAQYESCVNSFSYEEGKLSLFGYAFKMDRDASKTKYEMCFAKQGAQYYYPINTVHRNDVAKAYENECYADSGIWFSYYLFDLMPGMYDVGIIVEEGGERCFIDLQYDIEIN